MSPKHLEKEIQSNETGLIISAQKEQLLSKQQKAFNLLVKKIEKLRIELEQLNTLLDEKLRFYSEYIYPVQQKMFVLYNEEVRLLYKALREKKVLTNKHRQSLKAFISERLRNIINLKNEEPDEEFKEIFKYIEGIGYDQVVEEELEELSNNIQNIFDEQGFNVDFGKLNSKMPMEDLIAKMAEMQEQLKEQAEMQSKQARPRKKSKKQKEKEALTKQIEEAKNKNISSIYRQLAKIFHPDLEQNEALKTDKEALMKQLTIAYENNDLHTLLRLELEWIQKEESSIDKLTDEKLNIYNEVLKEQVIELEHEISETLTHTRYTPLHGLVQVTHQIKTLNLKREKHEFEETIVALQHTVASLKGTEKEALSTIKELLRLYTVRKQVEEQSDLFNWYSEW